MEDDKMAKLYYRINYGLPMMKRVMKRISGIRRK